jgi:hypothetical protein
MVGRGSVRTAARVARTLRLAPEQIENENDEKDCSKISVISSTLFWALKRPFDTLG